MAKRFLLGVDDSADSFAALEKVAGLFLKTEAHFHLFRTVTESHLPARPPTSTETTDWQGVQKRRAQQSLDKAVSLLLQMGYKRARISTETRLESGNAAQEILNAGKGEEIVAIVFSRRQPAGVKRLLLDATDANIYRYTEVKPLWAIGNLPLQPPHVLAAVDESDYADRIAVHLAQTLGPLPQVRVTFLNIMPAKPPAYWDDGHILDKAERGERRGVVKKWQPAIRCWGDRGTRHYRTQQLCNASHQIPNRRFCIIVANKMPMWQDSTRYTKCVWAGL